MAKKKAKTKAVKRTLAKKAPTRRPAAKKKVAPARARAKPGAAASPGQHAARADLGQDVGVYFSGLAAHQRSLAQRLDRLIRAAAPRATSAIKWGMPVYELKGMLCYIRVRPAYVTLGFYAQGTSLKDPRGLLEGTGDNMRHVKLAGEGSIDEAYLRDLVEQAVRINEGGEAGPTIAGPGL